MSTPPPPPRPRLLTAALVFAWLMGLHTLHEGYVTLGIVRNPLAADSLVMPPDLRQAFVDGIAGNPAATPLAVGQLVLGGFLLVSSVITLFGGTRRVSYVLQALAANALLASVAHVLGEPLQQAIAGAVLASSEFSKQLPSDVRPEEVRGVFRWLFRGLLAMQCLLLGLIAWVLSRPSTRAFLAFSPAARNEN